MNKRFGLMTLLMAVILLLTACSSGGQVMDGEDMVRSYTQISQEEAKQMMEQDGTQIIVDVRTKEEYDSGHIPGAICIPNESIGTEQPEELPDLDQIILVYCRSGNRSKQAAQKLFSMGYTNIYEFGGIIDWTGEIVTDYSADETEPESPDETGQTSAEAVADADTNTDADTNAGAGAVVGEFDFEAEKVLLNSGWEMPIIGTGTWTLSDEEAENSTYYALKSGMRLIDTARYYQNETGVGKGLARAIEEGIVTREEVFITSKIYGGDHDRAVETIDTALSDLGLDYIDLMLIHQPGADDAGVYKAMEEAVESGKLHSIGISNYYTKDQVDEVLSFAEITPAVIQNENHIYYQNAELRDYVKQYGIVMESWYPFGGRGHTQESFKNDVILDLAKAHGKTSAQIILRWHLQDGYIAIPGSSNPNHIAENYDIFGFELSEDEMNRIQGIDKQKRYEPW